MNLLFVLVLLCALQLVLSIPILPNSFSADITVRDIRGDEYHVGTGLWAVDHEKGTQVHFYGSDKPEHNVFSILRHDLGMQYWMDAEDASSVCKQTVLNGTMNPVWDWVSLSTFIGSEMYGGKKVDVWEAHIGYAVMQIAVESTDNSKPVFMVQFDRGTRTITTIFNTWTPSVPAKHKLFGIPAICDSPVAKPRLLGCVARSDMIARAKVWVANNVPYNQGGTYNGYREDCSGYVSMCWGTAKPGYTTSTIKQIAHPISKNDLQPGDCLLNAGSHVILFGGWTDNSKSHYMGYEETRPGEGTVGRPTPYPYWYSASSFIPYRYNSAC